MIKTIDEFLSRVAQATNHAPRSTWDGWQARCPAHDDRHASLSVSRGAAGRILLKCHAGCETSAVVAAIGWRLDDLTPSAERPDYHFPPIKSRAEWHKSGHERSDIAHPTADVGHQPTTRWHVVTK